MLFCVLTQNLGHKLPFISEFSFLTYIIVLFFMVEIYAKKLTAPKMQVWFFAFFCQVEKASGWIFWYKHPISM